MEEVSGSIPLSSTTDLDAAVGRWADFLAGVAAAEGCFSAALRPSGSLRPVFTVEMAVRDQPLIEALRAILGFGSIRVREGRRSGYLASACLTANSTRAAARAIIPFFDHHLAGSAKRAQFDPWAGATGHVGTRPPSPRSDAFLAGYVAGDGTFVRSGRRFRFAVCVADTDLPVLHAMRDRLGVGGVDEYAARSDQRNATAIYRVGSVPELVEVVTPYFERHLLPSHRRDQFDRWRAQLRTFWDEGFRRSRPCSVVGCAEPRRAKGLCRHHYYLESGS